MIHSYTYPEQADAETQKSNPICRRLFSHHNDPGWSITLHFLGKVDRVLCSPFPG